MTEIRISVAVDEGDAVYSYSGDVTVTYVLVTVDDGTVVYSYSEDDMGEVYISVIVCEGVTAVYS